LLQLYPSGSRLLDRQVAGFSPFEARSSQPAAYRRSRVHRLRRFHYRTALYLGNTFRKNYYLELSHLHEARVIQ
jgi:hypothetical protein